MVNMTLSLPEQLHKKMKQHPEFKWSDVARQAFERKLSDLAVLEDINTLLNKSTLTEADAERIGHQIKAAIRKRINEKADHRH